MDELLMNKDGVMMDFDEGFYFEKPCGGRTPKIGCDEKVWQNVVLHGLVIGHYRNKSGSFQAYPILGGHRPLRGKFDFDELDLDDDGHGITEHVIGITDLWAYTRRQLTMFGVYFEDCDADSDMGYSSPTGFIGLSAAIEEYLRCLAVNGYLIDLNMRMGHADEISYRLGSEFFKKSEE